MLRDDIGNVLGLIRGGGDGPKLVVAAHLDTVFPEGTDTQVIERDGRFYAPGIADDTRGLAEVLGIIRAIKRSAVEPLGDILFCGNVGEEGLGDLMGTKQLFSDHRDIDGFISIDGTGVSSITYLATGSHRYKISYKGPGGHSYGDFGLPSAIHASGRAIARIADLQPPADPKTTFTVGTVHGGTSVNAIAEKTELLIDIRSNRETELLQLEAQILDIIKMSVDAENSRWKSDQLTVDIELLATGRQAFNQPRNQLSKRHMPPEICLIFNPDSALPAAPMPTFPSAREFRLSPSVEVEDQERFTPKGNGLIPKMPFGAPEDILDNSGSGWRQRGVHPPTEKNRALSVTIIGLHLSTTGGDTADDGQTATPTGAECQHSTNLLQRLNSLRKTSPDRHSTMISNRLKNG